MWAVPVMPSSGSAVTVPAACRHAVGHGDVRPYLSTVVQNSHNASARAGIILRTTFLARVIDALAERAITRQLALTLSTLWITVEWSRPPNAWPISTSCISSSSRARYIAIWRGTVSVLIRAFERSPSGVTPQRRATTSCTLLMDGSALGDASPSSPGRILSLNASRASSIDTSLCLSEANKGAA